MSTPENEPQNPQTPPVTPPVPQYGQVAPEGQVPQPGIPQPNPYGQNPSQNPYGQNPNQAPYGQNPYGQNPNPYGQPPQAPAPYGQQPFGGGFPVPPQGTFPAPQMPTERPRELNISFWAILAAGIAVLINGFVGFPEALIRQQLAATPGFEEQMTSAGLSLDQFLSAFNTMMIILSVVGLGIYILIAFMVRKGSNVARIFATVFAALSLALVAGTLFGTVAVALGIIGVVFAWLRPSSNYIAARRAARAAGIR